MKAPYSTIVAAAIATACIGSVASAQPSRFTSVVSEYMYSEPGGHLYGHVLVHDRAFNPIVGSSVVLDFSACAQFHPCPMACTGCVVDLQAKTIQEFTDSRGQVDFDLRVGGSPGSAIVQVFADGVWLGDSGLASVDMDGDLTVTAADQAAVHALIGTDDYHADFTGDLRVTGADEAIVASYIGATCNPMTPVRPTTWGTLKSIYR
ncbi:MAG TPA: hypothetical protein VMJ70_10735 [Candidatus Sulfotelmatobacter sp.]|nr:hypothetical protein [Candidatus Sulfotelmatobacter sp.]